MGEEGHERRRQTGGGVSEVDTDAFRKEFAELTLQIGGNEDDDGLGQRRRHIGRNAPTCQHGGEIGSEGLTGIETREDAHDGDANLGRGEKLVGVVHQVERHACRTAAGLGFALQTGATR